MEREVNLLRCAKLSCYAEFNRMVQAIARSAGETGFQRVPGARLVQGTSAEYFFYTTLVSMLSQVVSNSNSVTQRLELQQVYEWFCTNKPLITAKTNPKHQKPKLSLTSRPLDPLPRPQTAPASLLPHFSPSPHHRPSSSSHRRPHTTQQLHGFTSTYMSRSLALSPSSTSHTGVTTPVSSRSRTVTPSPSQSRPATVCGKPERTLASRRQSQGLSVVELASQKSPQAPPTGQQTALNMATLLQLAPTVAARMEWQREMRPERPAPGSSSRLLVNTPMPAEHGASERQEVGGAERGVANAIAGCEESEEKTAQDASTASPKPSTESERPQSPSETAHLHYSPNITITKHTLSLLHTSHTPTTSVRPPVHVVTLGLPLPSHHLPTSMRAAPSRLRQSGNKAASGFNCSRYWAGRAGGRSRHAAALQ